MKLLEYSKDVSIVNPEGGASPNIYLFQQFFIPSSSERRQEIRFCLDQNRQNTCIKKIFLLNERVYSDEECGGAAHDKIVQVANQSGKRLSYADVFRFVAAESASAEIDDDGYIVISNADIFFDESINNVCLSDLSTTRKMFALVRHEFQNKHLYRDTDGIFPRFDSQDVWIFHTRLCRELGGGGGNAATTPLDLLPLFDFPLGIPGCDNKMLYLMKLLQIQIYNTPRFIRTFHCHKAFDREYHRRPIQPPIPPPYSFSVPVGVPRHFIQLSMGINRTIADDPPRAGASCSFDEDNRYLFQYITDKRTADVPFFIPLLTSDTVTEPTIARAYMNALNNPGQLKAMKPFFMQNIKWLMENKNFFISSWKSMDTFAREYMSIFQSGGGGGGGGETICDVFLGSATYMHDPGSLAEIHQETVAVNHKKALLDSVLELYHYIPTVSGAPTIQDPWSVALRGMKILVVTDIPPDIFQRQWTRREELFFPGWDFFPGCELVAVLPSPCSAAAGTKRDYATELSEFYTDRLDDWESKYDIALISTPRCTGGIGNLIGKYILEKHSASAMNIGHALPTYFGIVDEAWKSARPDISGLYTNPAWVVV